VIPCNWSSSSQTPIGFLTPDAQNIIVKEVMEKGFEYLFLLEDDVVPPADLFLILNEHMRELKTPLISGLVYVKPGLFQSNRLEPMIYRGRGNGAFFDWKLGDQVWADGVPTGCLLIHRSLLQVAWDFAEQYTLSANGQTFSLRRVFEAPRKTFSDIELPSYHKLVGTSDIYFCDRVLDGGMLKLAGWPQLAKKKYPFLVDTRIHCGHIDRTTGLITR
jgi:hypothetical protein